MVEDASSGPDEGHYSLFGASPLPAPREIIIMDVVSIGPLPDGSAGARFRCPRCGSDTGPVLDTRPNTKRTMDHGIRCERCSSPMKSEIMVPKINVAAIRKAALPTTIFRRIG